MAKIGHPDSDLSARLDDFRARHTAQSFQHERHQWQYYTAGQPETSAVLLLHGGGADAEAMFPYIERLSEKFYVIAPSFPASLRRMDDAVIGLRTLLAHLEITHAHLIGIAFGALIAQLFSRRFIETVQHLVLTHTVIPSDHLAAYVQTQRNLMLLYPAPLLRWSARRAYRHNIAHSTTPANLEQRAFWQTYVENAYQQRITKRHLISRASLTAAYHTGDKFASNDLREWSGRLLIVESEADDVIGEGDRGALLGMYPQAYVQTLYGYDHLAPILAADEIASSIENFLLKGTS